MIRFSWNYILILFAMHHPEVKIGVHDKMAKEKDFLKNTQYLWGQLRNKIRSMMKNDSCGDNSNVNRKK